MTKCLKRLKWFHVNLFKVNYHKVCPISKLLLNCMIVFHSVCSIGHGPPLSYLQGKKLRKQEEIDVGMNIVNSVGIFFSDSVVMNSTFRE